MANAFNVDLFKNYFKNSSDKALQQSNLFGDTPTYSLLSEGLDDGGDSMLQTGFGDETPISEVAPAENSAQRWERQSNSFLKKMQDYLTPAQNQDNGFLHLYDQVFNNNYLSRDDNRNQVQKLNDRPSGYNTFQSEPSRFEQFQSQQFGNSGQTNNVGYGSEGRSYSNDAFDAHTARLEAKGYRNLIDARSKPDPGKHFGLGGEEILHAI